MGWGADESDILGGINMTETKENRELKTQLQHIADGGYHCPRCGSENIESGERDSIDDREYRDFECLDCELRYTEEYILNGYWVMSDGIDNGPSLVEHLRQQLRWSRKTIAKLREDKKRQTFDLMQVLRERKDLRDMMLLSREPNVRCRSGMQSFGDTPLLKVRHKKGAIDTYLGGRIHATRYKGKEAYNMVALLAQGHTMEEADAKLKAASRDEEEVGLVLKANTAKTQKVMKND
jgi:DNA-directed RNA polymerase subunit RPC12/RpoP